jgi:hypothetical protein
MEPFTLSRKALQRTRAGERSRPGDGAGAEPALVSKTAKLCVGAVGMIEASGGAGLFS